MGRLAVLENSKLNIGDVTILVAGGNPIEVDVLMQVFSGFGAGQLRRGENELAIKTMLSKESTDLLVIDAMLGIEVSMGIVRWMRREGKENRYAPIILTAANPMPSLITQARDSGVNYIVAKPITPRVLFERLLWIVKENRAFIETDAFMGPDRRTRALGPPSGMAGRREGDLPPEVGDASTPNLSQADIDSMMFPVRKK